MNKDEAMSVPDTTTPIVVPDMASRRATVDTIHTALSNSLVTIASSPEMLTPAMVTAIAGFLRDNGAKLGVVTAKSPLGNLLENVPFETDG